MPKALLKDCLEEIRHSLGRFMSILLIVALGVAFFAGIKASAPDMKASADAYFDKYRLQDIQVYSTLGLTKEDVQAIEKLKGVEAVQPLFSEDVLTRIGTTEQVFKLFSLPDKTSMNDIRLTEGRLPEKPGECLIEAESIQSELRGTFELGDTITIYSGTEEPLSDTLKTDTYTVVGKGFVPRYLSYEKGSTTIGSGTINNFMFVTESDIKADYYTEIDVTVQGARDLNAYDDAYFDLTDPVVDEIEKIADGQIQIRKQAQQEELEKAQKKLDDEIYNAKERLREAQNQVDRGNAEIQANEKKLADGQAQLEAGWQQYYTGKAAVDENLPKVNDGIAQIEAAINRRPELESSLSQIEDGIRQAQDGKAQAEAGKAEAEEGLAKIDPIIEKLDPYVATAREQLEKADTYRQQLQQAIDDVSAQLETAPEEEKPQLEKRLQALQYAQQLMEKALVKIDELLGQYDELLAQQQQAKDGIAQAEAAITQCDAVIADLTDKKAQVESGLAQIADSEAMLPDLYDKREQLLAAQAQLESSLATLQSSEREIADGLAQLTEARKQAQEAAAQIQDGLEELARKQAEAQETIDENQAKLDDLEGEWVVLDRNSLYSYRDYQSCADRMDGIAQVFPVFFFLVAALVCMTTMTRMVEEQRSEIGTLKALGYSRTQIAMKYVLYSLLACLVGCVAGCALGMWIFPYIIFYAWNTMYTIESIQYMFQPGLMLLASGSVTAVILLSTIYSIFRELMEVPSQLMRPKAGKAGKKILLERVPVFWNRVPFLHKVTLRNIFRYKKRFFMTVIGISGCSALLVAGLGINDSISNIVNDQYTNIYHYDGEIRAKEDDLTGQLEKINGITGVMLEQQAPVTYVQDGKDVSAYLHVIPEEAMSGLSSFISFHDIQGKEDLTLPESGALISQKMAEKLDLKAGSSLQLKADDDHSVTVKVAGVFEQYTGNQIYVSQAYYESWDESVELEDNYLIRTSDQSSSFEDKLGGEITQLPGIRSITFYSAMKKNFVNMISSIKLVVVVLVASAALLAFVVLYNLSNVNISERLREIATIKVLGFTDREVDQYVNRESLILAVIGSACGLVLGIWLHHMIMNLAELDNIMFGRTILPQSFAIAFGLTIFFAAMVNFVMRFKLKKIQMVESLKAVE